MVGSRRSRGHRKGRPARFDDGANLLNDGIRNYASLEFMVDGSRRSRDNLNGRLAGFDDGANLLGGHTALEHILFEATRLDDSPDILGRHASLEHIQLELKVEPGEADLPCKDAQADAQDGSQGDESYLRDGHEPPILGEDFDHSCVSFK